MRNRELIRQYQIIRELISKTNSACQDDIELMAHWAKYLCVISAGFIENSLKEIYRDFIQRAASEPVANFSIQVFSKIQNPKTSRFIEIANSFKNTWGEKLELFVDEDGRREAIDAIMQNRHLIVHGKYSGITIARLHPYLVKAIEVIEFIEDQFNN